MPYTVTWIGPSGRERRQAATASDALRLRTTYTREAAKMVIKDEIGQRVTVDELARLADDATASKEAP